MKIGARKISANFEFQIEKYRSRVGWINIQPRLTPRLALVDPSHHRLIFFYLELKVALDSIILGVPHGGSLKGFANLFKVPIYIYVISVNIQ